MLYRVIGLMSGSSLDGLDIAYVQFEETAGIWTFDIRETTCIPYSAGWQKKLSDLTNLSAKDYLLLNAEYGRYIGNAVQAFIEEKNLAFQVQLISSHGHTAFHLPASGITAQLGNGAGISAITGIRTITDLRAVDVALGGQGAPIVPIGENMLFPEYHLFLNIGGIANISAHDRSVIGFDVCPANRVLNLLAEHSDKGYDENGRLAAAGKINEELLTQLNAFEYYKAAFPKSLSNEFGLKEVYPLIENAKLSREDALRTYVQHMIEQIANSIRSFPRTESDQSERRLLITGGGAHNIFLIEKLTEELKRFGIVCVVPDDKIIDYKEALIIALMGALRWREEINVMQTVTGASKDSINGALWTV